MATSPERRNSVSKPGIDREKTTPFLLRLFVRTGGFHRYVVVSRASARQCETDTERLTLGLMILRVRRGFLLRMRCKFILGKSPPKTKKSHVLALSLNPILMAPS